MAAAAVRRDPSAPSPEDTGRHDGQAHEDRHREAEAADRGELPLVASWRAGEHISYIQARFIAGLEAPGGLAVGLGGRPQIQR